MNLNSDKFYDFEGFEPVCGLEIHVQLKTKTKLFCSCPREFTNIPNLNICPICVGLPGVLPYPNRQAVILAVRASLLLNMRINRKSFFERKNYFYPDLPKNYQISQYRIPLAEDGFLEIEVNGIKKKIGIQRLHMEEDAGKMIHGEDISYVDFSRSGTPLAEIVTKPDISSPDEAYAFLTKLHKLLVWCDITEGSMEEGNLRCDVNVSVKPRGSGKFGTKVEIKNVNSFRFIKEAIEYEISRQISVIKSGGKIEQETRGYDSVQKKLLLCVQKNTLMIIDISLNLIFCLYIFQMI
jgi:aspartyl/glutamyl-tRNA(Asn/Gln) amidotransferase subunit B (EC 6.3.5.-)